MCFTSVLFPDPEGPWTTTISEEAPWCEILLKASLISDISMSLPYKRGRPIESIRNPWVKLLLIKGVAAERRLPVPNILLLSEELSLLDILAETKSLIVASN
jgi:hypothetical protein